MHKFHRNVFTFFKLWVRGNQQNLNVSTVFCFILKVKNIIINLTCCDPFVTARWHNIKYLLYLVSLFLYIICVWTLRFFCEYFYNLSFLKVVFYLKKRIINKYSLNNYKCKIKVYKNKN